MVKIAITGNLLRVNLNSLPPCLRSLKKLSPRHVKNNRFIEKDVFGKPLNISQTNLS